MFPTLLEDISSLEIPRLGDLGNGSIALCQRALSIVDRVRRSARTQSCVSKSESGTSPDQYSGTLNHRPGWRCRRRSRSAGTCRGVSARWPCIACPCLESWSLIRFRALETQRFRPRSQQEVRNALCRGHFQKRGSVSREARSSNAGVKSETLSLSLSLDSPHAARERP